MKRLAFWITCGAIVMNLAYVLNGFSDRIADAIILITIAFLSSGVWK